MSHAILHSFSHTIIHGIVRGSITPQVLIIGDSNAGGRAGQAQSIPAADTSNPGFNTWATQSTNFVYFDGSVDEAVDNPPSYINVTGGVQPYPFNSDNWMGSEISIGQEFTRRQAKAVICKVAIVGLQCAQMVPSPSPAYPTSGPSWYQLTVAKAKAVEAAQKSQTQIVVIFAGNNDGLNSTTSAALASNMSLLVNQLVVDFPNLKAIIWAKINSDTVNFTGGTFIPATITNQTTWFSGHTSVSGVPIIPMWWDDMVLQSDHAHGTPGTYETIGQRIAWIALRALGFTDQRPATAPQVVGYGPCLAANGGNQPAGWGGVVANDLELLLSVQMVGSGTEGTLSTPSGWTLKGSATSATASPGLQVRLALFSRVVDSTMLSNNHNNQAGTSVVLDSPNTLLYNQIITIRGVNPNTAPVVDFFQFSTTTTSTTSYSFTGGTATGSDLIVMASVGYAGTNPVVCSVTLTGTNISGLTSNKNGTHPAPDGNLTLMDIQSGTANSGAVNGGTATLGSSNICPVTLMVGIK